MAKKKTKAQYLQELDRLAPPIRKAYIKWVAERIGIASVSRVEELIYSGDVSGILAHLNINAASLSEFSESVRESFKSGGAFEAPAAQVTFNIRSAGAEDWLKTESSKSITKIVKSQEEGIREALTTGMRKGTNPRTTALDIIGRKGVTGKRTGGIVGLSGPQSSYVTNARAQLRSGDPAEMTKYFSRARRDKRYDGMVRAAIRAGRPLTPEQVNKVTGAYADRLLKLRGETIARTESIHAFNAARDRTWTQAIDEGKVSANHIVSTWSSTMDGKTRASHVSMNGQQRPYGSPFNSPTGAMLMYPGDTSLGAQAEDVVNCRCYLQREADFIGQAAAGFKGR